MRFLLNGMGSRGDIQPLVALGEALLAAGHGVRMLGSPNGRVLAESRGIEFVSVGRDVRAFIEMNGDRLNRPLSVVLLLLAVMPEQERDQFAAMEKHAPWADLVIAAGVAASGPTVCEFLGIPYRYVVYCSVLVPSVEHGPIVLPFHPMPRWSNRWLWRPLGLFLGWSLSYRWNRQRRRLGMRPKWSSDAHLWPRGSLVLAADETLSPVPRDYDPDMPCTGFWTLPPVGKLSSPLEAFLDAGAPPIYIGFGSMGDSDPEGTTRILVTASERAGVRLVISSGWAGLGDGELPSNCIQIGSAPHGTLLPRMAGAVHHGGAGTTSAVAHAGIPQAVVPHLLDQFYWAYRVHVCGLGPKGCWRTRLTVDRLTEMLIALRDDDEARDRAREKGEQLRGVRGLDTAVELFVGVVEDSRAAGAGRRSDLQ